MTRFWFILRNLRYFWGVNAALVLGMLVATAVLTGALMVGDSVRGSLADLALRSLGKVDVALISRRFFDQSLVERLRADPQIASRYQIFPAATVDGDAANNDETLRTGGVRIIAAEGLVPVARGQCILNDEVARALAISPADAPKHPEVLLSVPAEPDAAREAALSRRGHDDTLARIRAQVAEVHGSPDLLSLFNPQGGQRVPRNVWVNLADLQESTGEPRRLNALLVSDEVAGKSADSAKPLQDRLRRVVRLEDYGLNLEPAGHEGQSALTSRATYLDPPLVSTAEAVAAEQKIPLTKVTVNLVNTVTLQGDQPREIHYAVAAGIAPLGDQPLADDDVAINQWTADQLGAKVGDRLHLTFYQRKSSGDLVETGSDAMGFPIGFRVVRILPMSGLGADPSLTPQYKGLTDTDRIADWDPPEGLKIDKKLVTKADEEYWKQYKAAPKIFLSFATAQKLWGGPLGDVTSLRVSTARADQFRQLLHDRLDPAAMGLLFQPIKAQQLAASGGSTDFGEFFLYFSFFLIVAAVLLVAMLLRLSIEQRARQLGLLSAVGFSPRALRRLALGEGMMLALIGAVLGIPAAIGYTWFLMYGLRTWWVGAVGTTAMHLYVAPLTLVYGFVASLVVAFFAILWAIWRVGKIPAATLLAGGWEVSHQKGKRSGRLLRISGIVLAVLAVALLFAGASSRNEGGETALTGGAVLLIAFLCWIAGALRPGIRRASGATGISTIPRLGIRNASRHTARSVLAIGLIAFAAFTLITVAAFRQGEPTNVDDPKSGAGGYRLILQSGIPLLGDPDTVTGRRVLGMTDADADVWKDVRFVPMRRWAGQDISCLNLTKPTAPTILAIPPALVQVNAFTFSNTGGASNPWTLLDPSAPGGEIPVIVDATTAEYVLHLGVGQTMEVADESGTNHRVKLVATLSNSIFQSELLMGEANFRRLYPSQSGFGLALVHVPAARQDEVMRLLNSQLGEYAVTVEPTVSLLGKYNEIQNTYLSTFQALGALGLALGTIGLAVVLVRTVIERRAELALLASLGFRPSARVRLVLSENLFLLVQGLLAGAVCAGVGIIPALKSSAHGMNLPAIAATLLGVLALGTLASTVAVWISGKHISPSDLRRE